MVSGSPRKFSSWCSIRNEKVQNEAKKSIRINTDLYNSRQIEHFEASDHATSSFPDSAITQSVRLTASGEFQLDSREDKPHNKGEQNTKMEHQPARGKIYVGPAGWSYPDWEGIVYPATKPRGFHAASHLA